MIVENRGGMSESVQRFTTSIEMAGATTSPIGVPGHFLTFRESPAFEVTITRKWKSRSLDVLDNDHLGGVYLTRDATIGASSFARLCQMTQIRSVRIEYGKIATKWNISLLGNLDDLWSLSVTGHRFSDRELKMIGKLEELQILSLSGTRISNESGKIIGEQFPALTHLSIKQSGVKSPISDFVPKDIVILSLRGFELTHQDAQYLAGLPKLCLLDLRDGKNNPEVLEHIRENRKIFVLP